MKKITDVLVGFVLYGLLTTTLGYFLKEIWNTSIVPLFNAHAMTMTSSTGLIVIIWLLARVAADAVVATVSSRLSMFLADSLKLLPPPPEKNDET
jgi:hypothetical protein